MKIKIRISDLIVKILLKQGSLNQIRHCLTGYIQSLHKIIKVKKHQKIISKVFQ